MTLPTTHILTSLAGTAQQLATVITDPAAPLRRERRDIDTMIADPALAPADRLRFMERHRTLTASIRRICGSAASPPQRQPAGAEVRASLIASGALRPARCEPPPHFTPYHGTLGRAAFLLDDAGRAATQRHLAEGQWGRIELGGMHPARRRAEQRWAA